MDAVVSPLQELRLLVSGMKKQQQERLLPEDIQAMASVNMVVDGDHPMISVMLSDGSIVLLDVQCFPENATVGIVAPHTVFRYVDHTTVTRADNADTQAKQALFDLLQCYGEPALDFEEQVYSFAQQKQHQRNSLKVILLHGPSGCGKSHLIQQCLQYHQLPMHVCRYSALWYASEKEERHFNEYLHDRIRLALWRRYKVVVLDNIHEYVPVKSADVAEKFSIAQTLMALKRAAQIASGLMIVTTHDVNLIPQWFRQEFVDHEVALKFPRPSQRARILYQCIQNTVWPVRDEVVMEGTALRPCPPYPTLKPVLESMVRQCHGFIAIDLQNLWNHTVASALSRPHQSTTITITSDDVENGYTYARKHASMFRHTLSKGHQSPGLFRLSSKVTWDDIGGLQHAKHAIQQSLADLDILKRISTQHRHVTSDLRLSAGLLLYGPPGTGKTLLAKAVASQYNANFISIRGPDLVKAEIGESEKAIHSVFQLAKECRPCVVFFDEVDAVFGGSSHQFERGGSAEVLQQLRTHLLMQLDELHRPANEPRRHWRWHDDPEVTNMTDDDDFGDKDGYGVIVLAATNLPEKLDDTLTRPGRLDQLIYVSAPDREARHAILKTYLQKMTLFGGANEDEVVAMLVGRTAGFSGADLKSLCSQAGLNAIRRLEKDLGESKKHMEAAVVLNDFSEALEMVPSSLKPELLDKYERWHQQLEA